MKIRCIKCLDFLDESLFSVKNNICDVCLEYENSIPFVHTVSQGAQAGRRKLGLRQVDYDNLYHEQHGKCAICGTHQSELSSSLHVDHDHINGKIRGLLCINCNLALGNFKDNIENLINAIVYLKHNIKAETKNDSRSGSST